MTTYTEPNYEYGANYYLPSDWLDETLPDLTADPLLYVEQADGEWWLRLPEGNPDRANDYYITRLVPDQAISWMLRRIYAPVTVTVKDDGTFLCLDQPADANNFAHADNFSEDTYETVGDFVAFGHEEELGTPLKPGDYEMAAWHWSDDISMMFEVIDGKPSFREVNHH